MPPVLAHPMDLMRRFKPTGRTGYGNVGALPWLPAITQPRPGIRALPSTALPDPLGRIGNLELKLATTGRDVRRAQRLRYEVFYEEMSAVPNAATRLARRDMDEFDAICDHLLVLDHDRRGDVPKMFGAAKAHDPRVVGTYRLLRQEAADLNWGFYTASEFDIGGIVDSRPDLRFLELGRSCVQKPYRDKRTVELLWHGIWAYVLAHGVDAMIGCASLEGTDPDRLALPLSYLHHFHRAPAEWRAEALSGRAVDMNRMPKEAIDLKAALRSLPPLIKGYLRLGAYIGDGAVIDRQFGTVDVLMVLPVSGINPRYVNYYGADASRHAA